MAKRVFKFGQGSPVKRSKSPFFIERVLLSKLRYSTDQLSTVFNTTILALQYKFIHLNVPYCRQITEILITGYSICITKSCVALSQMPFVTRAALQVIHLWMKKRLLVQFPVEMSQISTGCSLPGCLKDNLEKEKNKQNKQKNKKTEKKSNVYLKKQTVEIAISLPTPTATNCIFFGVFGEKVDWALAGDLTANYFFDYKFQDFQDY